MESMEREWCWTEWENGTLELYDTHKGWESGWEKIFYRVAGNNLPMLESELVKK